MIRPTFRAWLPESAATFQNSAWRVRCSRACDENFVSGRDNRFRSSPQAWLRDAGVDTAGLQVSASLPTPRAWQVLEHDGRRTQVWRTAVNVQQLRPDFSTFPPAFRESRSFHMGIHPTFVDHGLISDLRAAAGEKGIVSLEPFTSAEKPLVRRFIPAQSSTCLRSSGGRYDCCGSE